MRERTSPEPESPPPYPVPRPPPNSPTTPSPQKDSPKVPHIFREHLRAKIYKQQDSCESSTQNQIQFSKLASLTPPKFGYISTQNNNAPVCNSSKTTMENANYPGGQRGSSHHHHSTSSGQFSFMGSSQPPNAYGYNMNGGSSGSQYVQHVQNAGMLSSPYSGPLVGSMNPQHQQDTADLQTEIAQLCHYVQSQTMIPSNVSSSVLAALRGIGNQVIGSLRELQHQKERLQQETARIRESITDNQRLLTNALAERDRACRERDDTLSVAARNAMNKRSYERLRQVETNLKTLNANLQEKVRFQEEQLAAKRALFMECHPSSSTRRGVQEQDPFTTPSGPSEIRAPPPVGGDSGSPKNLSQKLQQLTVSSGPKRLLLPTSSLTVGPTHPFPSICSGDGIGMGMGPSGDGSSSASVSGADPSTSLVPYKTDEEVSADFVEVINNLWSNIEQMTKTYYNIVNPLEHDVAIQKNSHVWPFLLTLTYENPQDAHTHTTVLLRDVDHRRFFTMRMAVTYVCETMWDVVAWSDYNDDCRTKIGQSIHRLKMKGLTPADRAGAVAVVTKLIQKIVDSKNFPAYRSAKLMQHTKMLRILLGPVLNDGAQRSDAGREIASLAVSAFDVGVKIHTSNWQFQFQFPEAGSKFFASSMISRNISNSETPINLQLRQTRLKLVVTPVITMRDDRGVSIRVKQVMHANVLTMQ